MTITTVTTATDAKNRFGQVLELAQKRPVFIEKAGRRHSVVMSVELYQRLLETSRPLQRSQGVSAEGKRFYAKYKDWVDEQHAHFEQYGIWNQEFRTW